MAVDQLLRKVLNNFEIHFCIAKINKIHAQFLAQGAERGFLFDQALADRGADQLASAQGLGAEFGELLFID